MEASLLPTVPASVLQTVKDELGLPEAHLRKYSDVKADEVEANDSDLSDSAHLRKYSDVQADEVEADDSDLSDSGEDEDNAGGKDGCHISGGKLMLSVGVGTDDFADLQETISQTNEELPSQPALREPRKVRRKARQKKQYLPRGHYPRMQLLADITGQAAGAARQKLVTTAEKTRNGATFWQSCTAVADGQVSAAERARCVQGAIQTALHHHADQVVTGVASASAAMEGTMRTAWEASKSEQYLFSFWTRSQGNAGLVQKRC